MSNPSGADLRWIDEAACRDLLFDDEGATRPDIMSAFFAGPGQAIDEAIGRMCRECPVRRECLDHSMTGFEGEPMPEGFYAGYSYEQRATTSYDTLSEIVEAESARFRVSRQEPRPIRSRLQCVGAPRCR